MTGRQECETDVNCHNVAVAYIDHTFVCAHHAREDAEVHW